jgi:uncharacterized membrane protein YgcG
MKRFALILAFLLILCLMGPVVVHAENEQDYGNIWVYDEANAVSKETEDYVQKLNENVFSKHAGKPQLAIIVVNDLPYNIDKYKLDMFNEYGVGTANENRGMLFVMAINDRQYALEIGDGFEKGSLLRKELETDFITEEMKNHMRNGDYDSAIMMIVQHLESLMLNEENGVYAQKEAEIVAQNQAKANAVIAKINQIGVVEYTDACKTKIKEANSAYNRLSSQQKELVTNYATLAAANDAYDELKHEATMETLKQIGLALCVLCPVAGIIVLLIKYILKVLRGKKVDELINRHYRQINTSGMTEDDIKHALMKGCFSDVPNGELEDSFMRILHNLYLDKQREQIMNAPESLCAKSDYVAKFESVNNISAFSNCNLIHWAVIVANVDAEEKQRISTDNQNEALLDEFWNNNRHRIENVGIFSELKKSMGQLVKQADGRWRLTQRELEEHFTKEKNRLDFKAEFDKFVIANKDKIDHKDFDSDAFYREVTATSNYANYSYQRRYDRSWMLPLMMMHMHNRKERRIEQERREKQERQERERRQREEDARRAAQRISSNNSSFGSSFGGGSSSGGGFKGGW